MTEDIHQGAEVGGEGRAPERSEASAAPGRARGPLFGVLSVSAYAVVALAVAVVVRLRTPGIPGYDSFYHFRHAQLYSELGIWMREFPWIVYSTMSRFAGDIGYGFHFFLIPFTFVRDEMLGMKLAAACETAVVLVLLYVVLRRHQIAYAAAWPFLLLFIGGPITYTFVMTRPQTLTMGFSALLLSFMVTGSAWGVLAASFLLAFFHLNAFAVVPVIVVGAAVVKRVVESQWEWWKYAAALGGIVLAWAVRPNPIGVAKLEYHQVIVHETARYAQLPLLFGREWDPVPTSALGAFAVALVLWGAAAIAIMAAGESRKLAPAPHDRTLAWSSMVLSALFFAVAVGSTKRVTPLWATCAAIVPAVAFTLLFERGRDGEGPLLGRGARVGATCVLAVVLGGLMWNGLRANAAHTTWTSSTQYRPKAPAEWLRDNGRDGEIIYNVNWSTFAELFFWNSADYYVSGLDPVFLYAYDPQLYWKFHHLATGTASAVTYGDLARSPSAAVDTYAFVHDELRASHIVVDHARNASFEGYLRSDPRFTSAFDDGTVAIYAVGELAAE
ncbi:MAG: hypothetical protein JSV65_17320 [Armatimonadota bacterium]|nr:MAG: hypothetical protein JSV65_17320 [Armatimonadota bacterium]